MAKAKPTDEELILEGLNRAFDSMGALPFIAPKGVFVKKHEKLAEQAVQEGFLAKEPRVPAGAKGKKPKPVLCGVLTPKGFQKVLDARSPKSALEALVPAVQALVKSTAPPPDAETIRSELAKSTEACVRSIQDAFDKLQTTVLTMLSSSSSEVDPQTVLASVHSALERVQAPEVQAIPQTVTQPTTPSLTAPAIEEEIVAHVDNRFRETTVGCRLDELMKELRIKHPSLTIGDFHEALRKLHHGKRIRLGGWPRMLEDLPEPELALFLSSKVMYYAQPI